MSEGFINSGEAWVRGPIIVSWADAVAGGRGQTSGRSLVLHEFAHALDMMDGLVNGTPLLKNRQMYGQWHRVMTAEYERLRFASAHGMATLLNQYGATNVAEFFAVSTECFFEQSPFMRQWHPALYQLLRDYYHQDPAADVAPA
jgi:Mlc titration factor MtfA (ptsG expression regulator)